MVISFSENIDITDEEYKNIAGLVYKWSGINLGDRKKELVKARLLKRIRALDFRSFKQYYDYVVRDTHQEELIEFINAISTNVTSFFREDTHFEFLTSQALPAIAARKEQEKNRKIRVWSAACATGEEVYTLAIALLEFFRDPLAWNIKVLGTDISTRALACAKAGLYDQSRMKNMPGVLLNKYFDEVCEKGILRYRVKERLRGLVVFGRLNLMEDVYPFSSNPDVVFCRNVMIYFDKRIQEELVKKIYRCMAPGGYFFTGHSESLMGINAGFKSAAPAVYQK